MVSLATSLCEVWFLPASPASCQSTVSTLTAGLNFYLLNIYQTPALCQELNTEQRTKEIGPGLCWKALPNPACTQLPLGSHWGFLFSLGSMPAPLGNLTAPDQVSHPSPRQQHHVPLFETTVQDCNFSCFHVMI